MKRGKSNYTHRAGWMAVLPLALIVVVISSVSAGPIGLRRGDNSSSGTSAQRSDTTTSSERSTNRIYSSTERNTDNSTTRASSHSAGNVFSRGKYGRDTQTSESRPTRPEKGDGGDRSWYGSSDRSVPNYPNSRNRVFERIGERKNTRSNYRYRGDYDQYYHSGYYRPYTGWRSPTYYDGFYYYSWPYTIEPCRYGYYTWSYDPLYAYPSAYFHYGYFPYIYRSRVVVIDRPVVVYKEQPLLDYDDYYLARPQGSIGLALDDVKRAWTMDQPGLILNHIRTDDRIAVYLDGEYSYSIDAEDYIAMTRDAFERIRTVSLGFDRLKKRSGEEVTAYGTHNYYGIEDDIKTVYVSYTFRRIGENWFITEVGSSNNPLGR